jgi:ribosomal protein S18 acetylase RimI-like enzyme
VVPFRVIHAELEEQMKAARESKSYLPNWILHVGGYIKRHGFRQTLARSPSVVFRRMFENRKILFYCDLRTISATGPADGLTVERKTRLEEIAECDWDGIAAVINPELARRVIAKGFTGGASMWLVRFQGKLAGYGWTMVGDTIPHRDHALGEDDVHLFDFHVFSEYRGRGICPFLVNYIVRQLAANGKARAYIETSEWNHAMLRSLRRTDFQQIAIGRTSTVLRYIPAKTPQHSS